MIELNERGKRLYLSLEDAFPGLMDIVSASFLIEQLRATVLPARTKRKRIRKIIMELEKRAGCHVKRIKKGEVEED